MFCHTVTDTDKAHTTKCTGDAEQTSEGAREKIQLKSMLAETEALFAQNKLLDTKNAEALFAQNKLLNTKKDANALFTQNKLLDTTTKKKKKQHTHENSAHQIKNTPPTL